jgi:hypothetical protein
MGVVIAIILHERILGFARNTHGLLAIHSGWNLHPLANLKSDTVYEVIPRAYVSYQFLGSVGRSRLSRSNMFQPTFLALPFLDSSEDRHFVVVARRAG